MLTSIKITTLEQARRIIRVYLRRWDIEVFFRILKTGCRVERAQLKTCEALIRALMIYLVIAWRVHYLTHLERQAEPVERDVELVESPHPFHRDDLPFVVEVMEGAGRQWGIKVAADYFAADDVFRAIRLGSGGCLAHEGRIRYGRKFVIQNF